MAFCRLYDLNSLEPFRELLAFPVEESLDSACAHSTIVQSSNVDPSDTRRDEDRICYALRSGFEACRGPLWRTLH